jgi:hypothetical protein
MSSFPIVPAIAGVFVLSSSLVSVAAADIVGFYEGFTSNSASWRNANGAADLAWHEFGGPTGGSYATSAFNLISTTAGGFPPTVIRAQSGYGSSAGAYAGNWIAAGVTGVSFSFRHDLSEAINVTGRFASANNFPGAAVVAFTPVASNVWTTIFIDLTASSPNFVSFEGSNHATVFSNIGNMQFGFMVPAALVGQDLEGHFDITNFSIVPAPGALALMGFAGCLGVIRRRAR